jgi:hypothetical protein
MGTRDPRTDAYIEKARPFARPILAHLREVVHRTCPEVTETTKWGMPHFDYRGTLCSMASFNEHCVFGFWLGEQVTGEGSAAEQAMGHFGRITSVDDLPPEEEIAALLRRAMELNEQGVKRPRTKSAARERAEAPPELLDALQGDARAAWERMPPGHRHEYAAWITDAKTAATRDRRIATAVEWIAEGKSRNWKYEKPRRGAS